MFLADTLSRAYLTGVHACSFSHELEAVSHTASLAIPVAQLQQLKDVSSSNPVMGALRDTIQSGWSPSKSELLESVYPYFDIWDELVIQDNLIFKGPQIVIPSTTQKEMMCVTHASHIGIEVCIRRARETMYWPRMPSELKKYISNVIYVCMAHRTAPGREPVMQLEFAARPWVKVGTNLCDHAGWTLLVVSDHYIEVEHFHKATTNTVSKALKTILARYGMADVRISDNGPQFVSKEFATFARKWGLDHITSSPHCPQSNRKAENVVRKVKCLFTKCRKSNYSEFLALMDWCTHQWKN